MTLSLRSIQPANDNARRHYRHSPSMGPPGAAPSAGASEPPHDRPSIEPARDRTTIEGSR